MNKDTERCIKCMAKDCDKKYGIVCSMFCVREMRVLARQLLFYILPLLLIGHPNTETKIILLGLFALQCVYVVIMGVVRAIKSVHSRKVSDKNVCTDLPKVELDVPIEEIVEDEVESLPLDRAKIDEITAKLVPNNSYLTLGLTIKDMSEDLDVSANELSQYFNQYLNMSFKSYINNKRIDYSIELIHNNFDRYTIDHIAKESGFQNRTTYYRAFKKSKGVSPTEYCEMRDKMAN